MDENKIFNIVIFLIKHFYTHQLLNKKICDKLHFIKLEVTFIHYILFHKKGKL